MPYTARIVSTWVKCDTRLYLNVCLTIRCINSLGDYCAAHVTVLGARVFAVAQITTINSVYMTILSLRFLFRAFEATPCSVLNNDTLSSYTARLAKRSPISTKLILSLRARVFNGICHIVKNE
jgi:hypothetical protein